MVQKVNERGGWRGVVGGVKGGCEGGMKEKTYEGTNKQQKYECEKGSMRAKQMP